jgi:hypothetical protein
MLCRYDWRLELVAAVGRFRVSLGFRRAIFDRIGGRPLTKRGDFDQQLIAQQTAIEAPGDPCQLDSPSSILRWSQTNAYHGQAFMRGPVAEGGTSGWLAFRRSDRESSLSQSRPRALHGVGLQAFPCSIQTADIGPTASQFSEKYHSVGIDSSRLG